MVLSSFGVQSVSTTLGRSLSLLYSATSVMVMLELVVEIYEL